jgi:hypothetical protein
MFHLKNCSFIFLILLLALRAFSEEPALPYRAVVKTTTNINIAGQKKTVESIATIAINGKKYRLQMIKPEPALYICNGTQTLVFNPITRTKQIMNIAGQDASAALQGDLLNQISVLSSPDGDVDVKPEWNFPANIRKLHVEFFNDVHFPKHIELLNAGGGLEGDMVIEKTQLSGNNIPQTLTYKMPPLNNPSIDIVTEYLEISEDQNMPDSLFSLNVFNQDKK